MMSLLDGAFSFLIIIFFHFWIWCYSPFAPLTLAHPFVVCFALLCFVLFYSPNQQIHSRMERLDLVPLAQLQADIKKDGQLWLGCCGMAVLHKMVNFFCVIFTEKRRQQQEEGGGGHPASAERAAARRLEKTIPDTQGSGK